MLSTCQVLSKLVQQVVVLYLILWFHVRAREVAKIEAIMESIIQPHLTLKKSKPIEFVIWLTHVVNSCKS